MRTDSTYLSALTSMRPFGIFSLLVSASRPARISLLEKEGEKSDCSGRVPSSSGILRSSPWRTGVGRPTVVPTTSLIRPSRLLARPYLHHGIPEFRNLAVRVHHHCDGFGARRGGGGGNPPAEAAFR